MKNWILVLLVVATTLNFSAQISVADTTYRPKTYDQQVEQFRSYHNSENDIIFLGNSITARNHWEELLQIPTARNRGISGDTTFGILERLDEITEGNPKKIFILIGINDISRDFPDEIIIENYKKILQRIKKESPSTRIYVQTILPVNANFGVYKNHYGKDDHILRINNFLKEMKKEKGLTIIDLHDHLDAKYTEEGLHLNAEGYKLWAALLK
jgi:lysophospholipase L1-like esterase